MRCNGYLGPQKAGFLLEYGAILSTRTENWKPPLYLFCIEYFVSKIVLLRAEKTSLHNVTVFCSEKQTSGRRKQLCLRITFQLFP